MEKQIQALQEILDRGKRIVFLPARVRPRKAEFRTSAALTDCISSSMIIRRRKSSAIIFLSRIRKSFTASTAAACFIRTPGPTPLTA